MPWSINEAVDVVKWIIECHGGNDDQQAWRQICDYIVEAEKIFINCQDCDNWNIKDNIYTIHCLGCTRCRHNSDLFNRRKVVTDGNSNMSAL